MDHKTDTILQQQKSSEEPYPD